MYAIRIALTSMLLFSFENMFGQDTSFVAEINRNFADHLPAILQLRMDDNPAIITGPAGNGNSRTFNTTLRLLPDGYQTIEFSDANTVRYETYLPYKNKASRDALYDLVFSILNSSLRGKTYSVETKNRDKERYTSWLLRQNTGQKPIGSEVLLRESGKQLGNDMYYLITLNVINKQQSVKIRPGSDSTKLRFVQPAELVTLLGTALPTGLKSLSMFTQTRDSTEFYPFVQMPQFAVQPDASHVINNYASYYAGQVRYEANRYFPLSREEALNFFKSLVQSVNPAFPKPPEILRFADNESISYVWTDMSVPYTVRIDYKGESSSFARQVNFVFKSTPDERNRFAIGADLKAAENGNAAAMNNVGVAYYVGKLVPQDFVKAGEYFRKAAEAGDRIGMTNYGMMLTNGKGVKKDLKEGLKWYEKATAGNFPLGLYKLALLCREGIVLNKDLARAIKLLTVAADSNYQPAIRELGMIYDDEEGFQDKGLAERYFRVSSASGDGYSTAMIGFMHENTGSADSAFMYYDKASTQKYPMAYAFIGDYRRKLKEYTKGWEAYQKGATQDNTYCMNKIASVYLYGEGSISADRRKAREWYQRSARLGNEFAKKALEDMDKADQPAFDNEDD